MATAGSPPPAASPPPGSERSAPSVSSLLSSLRQTQTYDYLRAGANPDLTKYLLACAKKDLPMFSKTSVVPEVIQFADEVVKINRKQKRQERVLLLTDKALYNFAVGNFKESKRRIPVRKLRGLILSRCSDELVFQVEDSYDYRYEIRRRNEVLEMLSKAFEKEAGGGTLMVAFSEEAQLRDMVITKDVLKTLQQTPASSAAAAGAGGAHRPAALAHVDRDPNNSSEDMSAPTPDGQPRAHASSLNSHHPNSPSHSAASSHSLSNSTQPLLPGSPISSASYSTAPAGLATSPRGGLSGPQKNVRRSLITHGTAMLPASTLAKLAAGKSGAYPAAVGQQDSTGEAASAAASSSSAVASPVTSPSNSAYRTHKKQSIIATLLSGAHGRNSSKAGGGGGGEFTGGGADGDPAMHAFRDPTSRVEGWLTKKKGSGKKWDRKYFILTNTHLQYYAPCIKSNFKLERQITVKRCAEDGSLEASVAASRRSVVGPAPDENIVLLSITSRGSSKDALILAFASEDDATAWTVALLHRNTETPPDAELEFHPHMEAWLLLKDSAAGCWVRRYVVLTDQRLWFFEMGLKGSIDFSQGVSAHSTNEIQPTEEVQEKNFAGRHASTRFAYRWNVSDSVRIFYLAADSEEDQSHWIASIDALNREHGKGGVDEGAAEAARAKAAEEAALLAQEGAVKLPDEFVEAVSQPAPQNQVTFVFTDVQASTSLWEKVPDAMDLALAQHDRLLRDLLKRFNGYEVKTEGDAFMVTFFTPIDAILWCLHVQLSLLDAEWSEEFLQMPSACKESVIDPSTGVSTTVFNGIRIRMGVHTGFPNARRNPVTGRMDYFGPVVNRSARVSDTGHGGQVVATQEVIDALRAHLPELDDGSGVVMDTPDERLLEKDVRPIVTDQGCHELKGINEPVRIFEVKPARLALRTLPPLRSATTEKLEKARAEAAAAAAAAQ